MTDKERIGGIIDAMIAMKRDQLRLRAEFKGLESIIRSQVPKDELPAWDKVLAEQKNRILQLLLESAENIDPAVATSLDKRTPDELSGIDEPLPPG
jgi:hypothetical protein